MSAPDVVNLNQSSTIVPYEAWNERRDPAEVLQIWRKWTRLTSLALTGLLHDSEGSVLDTDDVRLVHEVAYTADEWARTYECARETAEKTEKSTVNVVAMSSRRRKAGA